jgi:hypothetical protein
MRESQWSGRVKSAHGTVISFTVGFGLIFPGRFSAAPAENRVKMLFHVYLFKQMFQDKPVQDKRKGNGEDKDDGKTPGGAFFREILYNEPGIDYQQYYKTYNRYQNIKNRCTKDKQPSICFLAHHFSPS